MRRGPPVGKCRNLVDEHDLGSCAARRPGSSPGFPDYLWFTDSDVVHPTDALPRLVSLAGWERHLVSVMVRLRMEAWTEKLLIPAFVYFFDHRNAEIPEDDTDGPWAMAKFDYGWCSVTC